MTAFVLFLMDSTSSRNPIETAHHAGGRAPHHDNRCSSGDLYLPARQDHDSKNNHYGFATTSTKSILNLRQFPWAPVIRLNQFIGFRVIFTAVFRFIPLDSRSASPGQVAQSSIDSCPTASRGTSVGR